MVMLCFFYVSKNVQNDLITVFNGSKGVIKNVLAANVIKANEAKLSI